MVILKRYFQLAYLLVFFGLNCFHSVYGFNTLNGKIYDGSGNEVAINGVAWIGFQDSNFLGGLWNAPFNTIGTQHSVMQLLTAPWTVPGSGVTSATTGVSFKSIRLPIQPGIWHNDTTVQSSPFDFSSTNMATPEAGNGPFCDWTKGSDASGHCIQAKTAPNLLTAVINEFKNQNIYVMLDFHHRPGLGDGFRDGTVVAAGYTLQNYHDDIVNFVKTAPNNILGIDIYNEPHQLYWFQDNTQTTPAQPSWIKVIAAAASAAYDTNQTILLFVEAPGGTEGNDPFDPVYSQTAPICLPSTTKIDDTSVIGLTNDPAHCTNTATPMRVVNIGVNWGENFRSLLDVTQSSKGIAKFDAIKFRTMLTQAITANNFSATNPTLIADWLLGPNNDGNNGHIVFAPHLYGAEVGGWQSDANDSPIRFKWNFGFLIESGFPFVVGELGYDVQIPAKGGEDFFLDSVAPYLISKQINHNLFFWTWNFSDFPIGMRSSDSALTVYPWKEMDLYNLFNAIAPVQTFGTLCVTVPTPTGYTGTTFPTITATGSTSNYVFNLTNFNTMACNNKVAVGSYTLSGSSLLNVDGVNYVPAQTPTASVTQNVETDSTITYAPEPMGSLQINVSGDANCPISANQSFTVAYTMGSINKQVTLTQATPATVSLPVGSYMLSVTPDPLPSNQQCHAQYNHTINVSTSTPVVENIHYTYSPVSSCSVNAACNTWGAPTDSWAGSSCNLYIHTQTPMTNPAIFTMSTSGISAVTQAWGATAVLQNGNLTMTLTDPVNNTNIGFNASGIITLPSQAMLTTNGQTLSCTIVKQ